MVASAFKGPSPSIIEAVAGLQQGLSLSGSPGFHSASEKEQQDAKQKKLRWRSIGKKRLQKKLTAVSAHHHS